jgi:NAD(P)-dependent dehydrogenase (short-subunit alcohol dehydrogenase family)
VSALVRSLAIEYARNGIRVNAIVPGATETPLAWANCDPQRAPELRKNLSAEIRLGRLAEPEEPARAALWLFSSESSHVTGSHLVCDGGILAKASISFSALRRNLNKSSNDGGFRGEDFSVGSAG